MPWGETGTLVSDWFPAVDPRIKYDRLNTDFSRNWFRMAI